MCLNWSYLKNNSRHQCTGAPQDRQPSYFLKWRHWEPIESSYDPREALLKIPARGSRAPADGGFPLLRETRRRTEGARASELGAHGMTFSLSWPVVALADKKDGNVGTKTPDRAAERAEEEPEEETEELWVLSVCGGGDSEENYRQRR